MEDKLYACNYSKEYFGYEKTILVFVTKDIDVAKNWVEKFNRILSSERLSWYRNKYNIYEKKYGLTNIKTLKWGDRWYNLAEINKAYFIEMEIR
jgi:hypothetical protein